MGNFHHDCHSVTDYERCHAPNQSETESWPIFEIEDEIVFYGQHLLFPERQSAPQPNL